MLNRRPELRQYMPINGPKKVYGNIDDVSSKKPARG
jgi:hypothetical protein